MDNLVFVASPYRADAYETMVENQSFAIKFMRNLWERTNEVGFAPHTYFPAFLDEDDEYQRNVGIAVGLEIMKICKRMYVVGPTISEILMYFLLLKLNHRYRNGLYCKESGSYCFLLFLSYNLRGERT